MKQFFLGLGIIIFLVVIATAISNILMAQETHISKDLTIAQLGSFCQMTYTNCNRDNRRLNRADIQFCNSNAFNNSEILRMNCLDKAAIDYQIRVRRCERRFNQCWWIYDEEDSFSPFPRRF